MNQQEHTSKARELLNGISRWKGLATVSNLRFLTDRGIG